MAISQRVAQADLDHARSLGVLEDYADAAQEHGFERALLLGKDSRESHLGRALNTECKGDGGNGFGISQVDRRFWPGFTLSVDPCNHRSYIFKGASILRRYVDRFQDLKSGLAAYNAGAAAVASARENGRDVDAVTTGGDYASDVLSRRDTFRSILGEPPPTTGPPMQAGGGAFAMGLLIGLPTLAFLLR